MAEVRQQTIDSLEFLGGIYQEIENGFKEEDYSEFIAEIAEKLRQTHKEMFDKETGPDGAKWQPNAPSTIKAKGHSTVLLGKTGDLKASLTNEGNPNTVQQAFFPSDMITLFSWGTSIPYSIFHQEAQRIPRRPHVGVTEEALEFIVEGVADRTVEALKPGLPSVLPP